MEQENASTENFKVSSEQEAPVKKTQSIKKLYLKKRALAIRNHFDTENSSVENFVREITSEKFNATKDELLFAKSISWMQRNLHTKANINDLADLLSVSTRKIQRLFSFFLEKTYTTVLLEMRMDTAKTYLKELNNSVGKVAYLVGINDHAYFTFLFRKSTGLTPSEFRTKYFEKNI